MTTQPVWTPTLSNCDDYLNERTGKYEYRAIRYRKAIEWMFTQGLTDTDTICDIGAGWTELDYCLRKEYDWKGRYIPIDGGISNIDLNFWVPEREVEFFVALEILEHLHNPQRLMEEMKKHALKGVAISTPNPDTVDVLGIDDTHVIEVTKTMLKESQFSVTEELLYGGVFSEGKVDGLMGFWVK